MPSTTMAKAKPRSQSKPHTKKQTSNTKQQSQKTDQQHSWGVVRGFLQTCKHSNYSHSLTNQNQSLKSQKQKQKQAEANEAITNKKSKKMKCSGSLCNNTKVMQRPDQNQNQNQTPSSQQQHIHNKKLSSSSSSSSYYSSNTTTPTSSSFSSSIITSSSLSLSSSSSSSNASSSRSININNNHNEVVSSSSNNNNNNNNSSSSSLSSFKGMGFSRFSGCYECRMVVDPVMGFAARPTVCPCPHCGQIFLTSDALLRHQSLAHAVSELGAEDTSKNIVEIIFQSSWVNQNVPPSIHRVLKVNNPQSTLAAFESYRDAVKSKCAATASTTRCAADGNELLRFRAAAFSCSLLALKGSTALCGGNGNTCSACHVIRTGFKGNATATRILTTATSGRAHAAEEGGGERMRAMLVCRVIAGRVRKSDNKDDTAATEVEFDSVAGAVGVYSNLDELYVFDPKAILPCFVVIYSAS